jgi:hypothetical protein
VATGAGCNSNKAIRTLINSLLSEAIIDNVMQHYTAVRVNRFVNKLFGA